MRRADRLFDILQTLRVARQPMTAAEIAERLEVTVRTVYRDIVTLQARRIPIEGERGIGYMLRRGFDLPPLMFTSEEIEAIAVGARLVRRLRDPGLRHAADSVLAKITTVLPEALKDDIGTARFVVSDGNAQAAKGIDLSELRRAIRETRKVRIAYSDAQEQRTERTVWPIAMVYYVDVTLLGAWCEMRNDFRHFRVERIESSDILDTVFPTDGGRLMQRWFALQADRQADEKAG